MKRSLMLGVALLAAAVAALAVPSAEGAKPPSPPGKGPKLTITPASATFGPVAPGLGASQELVLGFKDGTTSGGLTVTVGGDEAFAITTDTCTGTAISTSRTCTVTVTYTPTGYAQTSEGTLTVAGKKDVRPASALLAGSSTAAPLVSAEPEELGFGERELGESYPPLWITFTNNATETLFMTDTDAPNGFAPTTSSWMTCWEGLAPGATCFGAVTFNPTATGYYEGTFTTTWVDGEDATVATTSTYVDGTLVDPLVPQNRAPSAYSQSNVLVVQDTATTITLSGGDPDGDALSFTIWADESAEHGSLGAIGSPSCSGSPSVCTADVVYTPDSGYTGSDRIAFYVHDGVVSNWNAWVTIIVTPADGISPWANTLSPSYVPDQSVTITLSGGDPNGDGLTFELYDGPLHGMLSEIGTASCTSDIPSICEVDVTYTPDAGYDSADSFSYRTFDGANYSNVATVSLNLS